MKTGCRVVLSCVDRMLQLETDESGNLKGNCSEKFLLQNIFGFHVYITNIYVILSTETVIMQKKL